MRENHVRILCSVIKVDLVYEAADGMLTSFSNTVDASPLIRSAQLRQELKSGLARQNVPYLMKGREDAYFAVLHAEDGYLYMGPMCCRRFDQTTRIRFYEHYGVSREGLRVLPVFTFPEIRNMILLTNIVLENTNLDNEELLQLNRIFNQNMTQDKRDQTRFILNEEEENDDSAYRHSYHEEQLIMQAVREGRTEDAIRISENLDKDSGRLGSKELQHHRNLAIVGITLCSRAAIEGGLFPESAYRISGYYIKKTDEAVDLAHLLYYRNRAIEELCIRVSDKRKRQQSHSYADRAKDYVKKHYREKIYLEDVAEALSLSPSYLSRFFKKETGECLQDFINRERVKRAADLLVYSELSLPEISVYVGFPNQSYFGKIFKKLLGTTPKVYRDQKRNLEAEDSHEEKTRW